MWALYGEYLDCTSSLSWVVFYYALFSMSIFFPPKNRFVKVLSAGLAHSKHSIIHIISFFKRQDAMNQCDKVSTYEDEAVTEEAEGV